MNEKLLTLMAGAVMLLALSTTILAIQAIQTELRNRRSRKKAKKLANDLRQSIERRHTK